MFVIGTAGHVDHGKTALIKALTGIDADRLPEEKARGMTTDLGFAYFEGPGGECVGIVDVPGHERFLRNMVAGAWGLDMALLIVAADDGWMAQSRTHARILAALSSPEVLLVVTKIDAVSGSRAEDTAREAQDRCAAIFGFRPDCLPVSARTGEGIEGLRAAVTARLFPDRRRLSGRPYLFVDRVFSLPGTGTVAAGTLRGGLLCVKDELVLWPAGERVRIRSLESYKTGLQAARPVCRTAVALPKPRSGLRRGDLLADAGLEVLSGREFLCRLEPLPGEGEPPAKGGAVRRLLRPGMEAEVAVGSAHRDAVVSPYRTSGYLRLVCAESLACPAGQRFVLLRRGGTELLARGRILFSGATDIQARRALDAALSGADELAASLSSLAEGSPDENSAASSYRWALDLRRSGWTALPQGGFGERASKIPDLETAGAEGRTYAFTRDSFARFRAKAVEAAGKPGGSGRAEMESSTALPAGACGALLGRLEAEKVLLRSGPRWTTPGPSRPLDREEVRLEALLRRAGAEGIEPGKNVPGQDARVLRNLCALGRGVCLDNGVYWHRTVYETLAEAVLRGRGEGETFSVGDAKERSGLSRKYVLPLLNRMEDEKLVKRSGDVRVVSGKGARVQASVGGPELSPR